MRFLLFALPLLLFISSCGSTSRRTGEVGKVRKGKAAQVISSVEANAFEAKYLDASARVKIASRDLNIGGTASIRVAKDEAIWMSVKKFGIEGARALIRPDSFFVYNRLKGEYLAEPLSYIERKYNVPARFDLLQEIVLGNAVFFTRNLSLKTTDGYYELSGADSRYATDYVIDASNYQTKRMSLAENGTDRRISISNGEFKNVPGASQPFAHERTLLVDAKDSGPATVEMSFSRVKLDGPLAMPFRRR